MTEIETRDLGLAGIAVTPNRMRQLREEVVKTLAESMKLQGQLQPIVVRPRGPLGYLLVAGKHRYEAARLLKWSTIRCSIVDGLDADKALLAEIDENLIRGNLTFAEEAAHHKRRQEVLQEIGKASKRGGPRPVAEEVRPHPRQRLDDIPESEEANAHNERLNGETKSYSAKTAEELGKGESSVRRAIHRAKVIDEIDELVGTCLDEATELDALAHRDMPVERRAELIRDAKAGKKVSAKVALKQMQRAKREEELAEATKQAATRLGTKLYGVIYIDPPWRFEPWSRETGMDRAADNHYPTEELADLKTWKIPAADDAVIFMWTTSPMLAQSLELMATWGFVYKSNCIWVKPHAGTGYWFRNRHEQLLVGTKGKVPAPALGEQYDSVIEAPLGEHSVKPNAFAEMIEDMFPNVPALEMCARGPRLGWDVWGNEAPEPMKEPA